MDSPVVLVVLVLLGVFILGLGARMFLGRRRPGSALEDIGRAPREVPSSIPLPGHDAPSTPAASSDADPVTRPPTIRVERTRRLFSDLLSGLRGGSTLDDSVWDQVEETLLLADVGITTSQRIVQAAKGIAKQRNITQPSDAVGIVREVAVGLFPTDSVPLAVVPEGRNVWMFVGVNGVGKTTSIAKIGSKLVGEGRHVVLAAGDTFRAAAADQLSLWAERLGVEIIRGQDGGDPGSVVFDALAAANARNADVVLVDTAGRLQSNSNLMEELAKLRRIIDRHEPTAVETLLVLDATTGQNGLSQARHFLDTAGVTGIVLTKLDGSSKGGIVLAIAAETGIPVRYVGVGEGADDLLAFDATAFIDALFDTESAANDTAI